MNARKSRSDAKGEEKKQVATVSAFLTVGSCRRQRPTIGTKPTVGKAPTVATSAATRVRSSRRAARAGFTLIELVAAMWFCKASLAELQRDAMHYLIITEKWTLTKRTCGSGCLLPATAHQPRPTADLCGLCPASAEMAHNPVA